MSGQATALAGVRLGVLERTLLVNAPPLGSLGGLRLGFDGRSRSERDGYLRASRKLARLGLIRRKRIRESTRARDPRRAHPVYRDGAFWHRPDGTRAHIVSRVFVWVTPLGEGIRTVYARELASGSPIRWTAEKCAAAERFAETDWKDPIEQENAERQLEAQVNWVEPLQPAAAPLEARPPEVVTTQQSTRWAAACRAARSSNPSLGSTALWTIAVDLYHSEVSDERLKKIARQQHNRGGRQPLRFQRTELGQILFRR